jgi:predicted HicB family RNase H-like nuclease
MLQTRQNASGGQVPSGRRRDSATTKALNVRIPDDLHQRVNVFTALQRTTITQFVIQALEEKLARDDASKSGGTK